MGYLTRKDKALPDQQELTDAEWREKLSPEQYQVLRQAGTERAALHAFAGATDIDIYFVVARVCTHLRRSRHRGGSEPPKDGRWNREIYSSPHKPLHRDKERDSRDRPRPGASRKTRRDSPP